MTWLDFMTPIGKSYGTISIIWYVAIFDKIHKSLKCLFESDSHLSEFIFLIDHAILFIDILISECYMVFFMAFTTI